ncbi:Arc family DNA-binding protein [Hansschlegelia sp.]|uniref:Arc family DNA-binding protein n=1 Tax=Hansschlegelia sp. TaxID=2041892 RepID=UPI002D03899B|nr:Arc family DNA-binding protein [Hansschlegelia sp.]HVI30423.1 Arc family DNA-binding protein [Hansschlegelia sp.]
MSEEGRTYQDKFMLRMPEGLRDRIKVAAQANGRSMNAEIVDCLEEHYPAEPLLEDLIYLAREVVGDFQDAPDYARLKELRDVLSNLVDALRVGKENGYSLPQVVLFESLERDFPELYESVKHGRLKLEDAMKFVEIADRDRYLESQRGGKI